MNGGDVWFVCGVIQDGAAEAAAFLLGDHEGGYGGSSFLDLREAESECDQRGCVAVCAQGVQVSWCSGCEDFWGACLWM